jgi:hypothetical protein
MKTAGVFASVDKMWRFNVQSAVAASHIACNFLKENGVCSSEKCILSVCCVCFKHEHRPFSPLSLSLFGVSLDHHLTGVSLLSFFPSRCTHLDWCARGSGPDSRYSVVNSSVLCSWL